jgi:hypothetical protein
VLATEVGTVFTDDFLRPQYARIRDQIRRHCEPSVTVKLWGCNSGIPAWVYSDGETMVTDPRDRSQPYYWRALNERNVPKPAVAQAVADYFGCVCYGASSGSHIEVRNRGRWVSSGSYRAHVGHWPSGSLRHRLSPDRGGYNAYSPAGR